MNSTEHTSPSERTPALEIGDIVDLVDTTRHLNEVLFMAASDSGLTKTATNALQALIDILDKNLSEIGRRLEMVRTEGAPGGEA